MSKTFTMISKIKFMCAEDVSGVFDNFLAEFESHIIRKAFRESIDLEKEENEIVELMKNLVNIGCKSVSEDDFPLNIWLDNISVIKYMNDKFYFEQSLFEQYDELNGYSQQIKKSFINNNIDAADIYVISLNITVKSIPAMELHLPYTKGGHNGK